MKKQEFLRTLKRKLSVLPKQEAQERINFYSEMIDDRIEEGFTEAEAVAKIAEANNVFVGAESDDSMKKGKNTKPPRRFGAVEILLLVLGSPIWLSFGVAAFAVIISLYAVLWSLLVALFAVCISLAAVAVCGIVVGIWFAFGENTLSGIALIGAGAVCAGLVIPCFFGCRAALKGIWQITKAPVLAIKNRFM